MGQVQRDIKSCYTKILSHFQRKKDYIDFSNLEIRGYKLVGSTYNRFSPKKDNGINALAKDNCIAFLSYAIRVVNKKRNFIQGNIRDFFATFRLKHIAPQDTLVYQLYCNGFQTGYKAIDRIIEEQDVFGIEKCNYVVNEYFDSLLDYSHNIFNEKIELSLSQIYNHIIDVGAKEGATLRGLLFAKQIKERSSQMINIFQEEESFDNIFMENGLFRKNCVYRYIDREHPASKEIAILYLILVETKSIHDFTRIAEFTRIIEMSFCYNVGDKSNIYSYLNPNTKNRNIKTEEKENLIKVLNDLNKAG